MTNEEAIKLLSQIKDALLASNSWLPSTDNPIKESFGMAINALTAQPETHEERTETHACDCISRQAAIDALRYAQHRFTVADEAGGIGTVKWSENVIYFAAAERVLNDLPSAQPERKKGKWIYNSPMTMKCDRCGFAIKDWDWHRFKFCPNCDCDMRGEQE